MPLYEYQCLECGNQFETRRSMSEANSVAECKTCHSRRTVKLLSQIKVLSAAGPSISASDRLMGESGCCGGGACGCSH